MILCLETSTAVCSVALVENGKVIALRESLDGQNHAEKITIFIDEVMKEANVSYRDLDAVATSMGPGSYTGLRIGVSTAKGLCYAMEKPLIAIDTLAAMAHGFKDYKTTRLQDYKEVAETQRRRDAECDASTGSATEKLMAQSRDASTMSFIKQNENSFTEDIVDTSVQKSVLYIDPKQIKLEGHDHGFFPGCCGVWKNNLIVCGSTKHLKEKEALDKFLKDNGFNLIELYDGELVDVGSVLIIEN